MPTAFNAARSKVQSFNVSGSEQGPLILAYIKKNSGTIE